MTIASPKHFFSNLVSGLLIGCLCLAGGLAHAQSGTGSRAGSAASTASAPAESKGLRMWMTVNSRRFAITLADNAAARALVAQLPRTLEMDDLNNNEKTGRLPKALPTDLFRPGTIRNGDLLLWGSDALVVFYVTFDSTYSYTRLGKIDDPGELAKVFGSRGVKAVFTRD